MDPVGFGLESFDALGRFRKQETILIERAAARREPAKKVNLDLDTRGEVAGIPNSTFSDARQLGVILSQSKVCQECMVRQMFRYAFGRRETSADENTIERLYASFRDSGFHFKGLLTSLVNAPQFTAGLEDNRSGGSQAASAHMMPAPATSTAGIGSGR
jgi:hypothetical protein